MNDTRRDKRAPVSLKVRFKSATVDEFREQYSIDISRGGLFIKSKSPMAIGTLLKFEFQLKDKSRLIHGVGRVVWARPASAASDDAPAGMGIKFIKMDPESRALVLDIVESRGAGAGRYDDGAAEEPAAAPEAPMFPDLPPAELPPLEDRTAVRHANEFLASALAQGEAGSSAEAEQLAEEARRRAAARDAGAIALSAGLAEAVKATAPAAPPSDAPEEPPSVELSMSGLAPEGGDAPHAGGEDDELDDEAEAEADAAPYDDLASVELPAERLEVTAPSVAAAAPAPAPAEAKRGSRAGLYVFAALVLGAGLFVGLRQFGAVPGGPLFGAAPTPEVAAVAAEPAAAPEPVVEEPPAPEPVAEEPVVEAVPVDVQVKSTPRGAAIFLGEEALGETPATVSLPLGQEVSLTLRAPGYRSLSLPVTASEGGPAVEATLEALPYVVHVVTTPPGATARLGAQSITTPGDLTLPGGSANVSIRVSLPGYRAESRGLSRAGFVPGVEAMERTLEVDLREQGAARPAPAPAADDDSAAPAAPTTPAAPAEVAPPAGESVPAPAPEPAAPAPSPEPAP